ncbi:MAG: EAL domain-containing protein [Kineosporiaceae bacterium]
MPYAQPVFSLDTGRVVSAELLARWVGEDGRFVSPMDFIPLAEDVGLIRDLGTQMLDHAVATLRAWQQVPDLAGSSIAVNISPLHVVDGLYDDVVRVLHRSQVRPASLTLEITEQQALPDEDGTKEVLEAVRALGVRIAIDDFGSGFSSIRWLISLPVQVVKLDRSLLAAVPRQDDPAGTDRVEVLRSVNRLAEAMGRIAVAEGIETAVELADVRRAGIGLGQGYLLCRPMPLEELTARASAVCAGAGAVIRAENLGVA